MKQFKSILHQNWVTSVGLNTVRGNQYIKASVHNKNSQKLATIALPLDGGVGVEVLPGTFFEAVHLYEKTGTPVIVERTAADSFMGGVPVGRAETTAFEYMRPYWDQLVGSIVVNTSGLRVMSNGD